MPRPDTLDPMDILAIRQMRPIDDLNGFIEIMTFLHRYERGTISNFIKDLRLNQQPVYRTLRRLEKHGIVTVDPKDPKRKEKTAPIYYRLTEFGQNLAAPLDIFAQEFSKKIA